MGQLAIRGQSVELTGCIRTGNLVIRQARRELPLYRFSNRPANGISRRRLTSDAWNRDKVRSEAS